MIVPVAARCRRRASAGSSRPHRATSVIAVDAAARDADVAIGRLVVVAVPVVRAADVVLVVAAVAVPVVRAADVATSAVRVTVALRAFKVPKPARVPVVQVEISAVAIAIVVLAVVPVVPVVLVVRAVLAPRAAINSNTHPVASSVLRSRHASVPTDSLCRRAASARASRSDPMQMASDPTESRGIPSVVRSVRPSVRRR
jgi:hypothetical protein